MKIAVVFALFTFGASPAAADLAPFTVAEARSLPARELADQLLGERLASRVIEAKRYEYDGSTSIPQFVEFFTQPELSMPVVNGICRTDVIIIEYDWFEQDEANASTPLKIARIAARSRYKSFPVPPGEPGSEEHTQAQAAACAQMKRSSDAFRAPGGGDAQWLAAIHREYSKPDSRFTFTCADFADASCVKAREKLRSLELHSAKNVELVDCPKVKTGDQVNYCYRLTFGYPQPSDFPEIGDYTDLAGPEWIMTVFAGRRDGFAPVKIRLVHLEHLPPPLVLH